MRFEPTHLETLLAITAEGSFEAAARSLHVTPSAVSQRVRALESAAGQVLVRRTTPATVTAAGEPLLRLARQLRLLADEAEAGLDSEHSVELAIAVNADSLATWFRPVLGDIGRLSGIALRLHIEDQAHSHELVRSGEVLAALTDSPQAVQGCTVERLGSLRYSPAITPDLLDRHRRPRGIDWARLPMVQFNHKDRLQHDALDRVGAASPLVVHRVPSSADFHTAVIAGLGWGMLPEPELRSALSDGSLVRLPRLRHVDVGLHWQRWRLESPALTALGDAVRRAARGLR